MDWIEINRNLFEIDRNALTMIVMCIHKHKIEYLGDNPKYLILAYDTYISMCVMLSESNFKRFSKETSIQINFNSNLIDWTNHFEGIEIIIDPTANSRVCCIPSISHGEQALAALRNRTQI